MLIGINLQFKSRHPGPVHRVSELTKIAVTEDRRIQDIDQLVVETFQDRASQVLVWIDDKRDGANKARRGRRTGYQRSTASPCSCKRAFMVENELRSDKRRNRSHVDMPPIGAYRQALEPLRTINGPVGPFVSDFRVQQGISELVFLDLHISWIVGGCGRQQSAAAISFGIVRIG